MRRDRGWTAGRRSLVTPRLLVYRHVGEDGVGSSAEDTHTHTDCECHPERRTDREKRLTGSVSKQNRCFNKHIGFRFFHLRVEAQSISKKGKKNNCKTTLCGNRHCKSILCLLRTLGSCHVAKKWPFDSQAESSTVQSCLRAAARFSLKLPAQLQNGDSDRRSLI